VATLAGGLRSPKVRESQFRAIVDSYIESLNGKLADELSACGIFDTLLEAKVLIERWRVRYNTVRPHSSLGYRPPAPAAAVPWTPAPGASLLGPASMAGALGALT
jgi:putative transposase